MTLCNKDQCNEISSCENDSNQYLKKRILKSNNIFAKVSKHADKKEETGNK